MRVLSLIEANFVTGPAKLLLEFATLARELPPPLGPIEITLATYRHPSASGTDAFLEAAAAAGVPCEVLYQGSALDRSVTGALGDLAKRVRPDLIDTHSVKSHFWVAWSGLARRYPWVAYHHGYTWPTMKQRAYNQFDRWSLRRARLVVTVTKAFVAQLESVGVSTGKIRTVFSSIRADWADHVDPLLAAKLRSEIAPAPSRIVLAVGRLSKEKGHADLIQALAVLGAKGGATKPHLVLLGDGHELGALRALAESRACLLLSPAISRRWLLTLRQPTSLSFHRTPRDRPWCWLKRWPPSFPSWRQRLAACLRWSTRAARLCWFQRGIRRSWRKPSASC